LEEILNYFEVFGLDRKLGIDTPALQRRFYELSRQSHPDFHQAAPPDEQARILEVSARLNAAYRALRDPIARVEYLVRLEEGRETKEGDETIDGHGPSRSKAKPKAPPELLAEMFEIQEALQEARAGGLGDATRATLTAQRARLIERRAAEEARITGELTAAWDAVVAADGGDKAPVLTAFKEGLATRAYLRTVIDDLNETLEGHSEVPEGRADAPEGHSEVPGEGHVAHHRH
jgi:molecular chaperone HscB